MRSRPIVFIVLLLSCISGAQVVDRVAATVNGRAILVSQVDEACRFAALLDGRKLESIADSDRASALSQLIDQELTRQRTNTTGFVPASDQEVAGRVADLRAQIAAGGDDAAWKALLQQYGLDEGDFRFHVRSQLNELRFIDMRFRPSVQVTPDEVDRYYREQYVPKVRQAGAEPRPLKDVRAPIEEILTQQEVDRALAAWLEALRNESQVRILVTFSPRSAAAGDQSR